MNTHIPMPMYPPKYIPFIGSHIPPAHTHKHTHTHTHTHKAQIYTDMQTKRRSTQTHSNTCNYKCAGMHICITFNRLHMGLGPYTSSHSLPTLGSSCQKEINRDTKNQTSMNKDFLHPPFPSLSPGGKKSHEGQQGAGDTQVS